MICRLLLASRSFKGSYTSAVVCLCKNFAMAILLQPLAPTCAPSRCRPSKPATHSRTHSQTTPSAPVAIAATTHRGSPPSHYTPTVAYLHTCFAPAHQSIPTLEPQPPNNALPAHTQRSSQKPHRHTHLRASHRLSSPTPHTKATIVSRRYRASMGCSLKGRSASPVRWCLLLADVYHDSRHIHTSICTHIHTYLHAACSAPRNVIHRS